jgi:undecaprenyl phosphate-alpha-L-ara4N flippase subunit ArnE
MSVNGLIFLLITAVMTMTANVLLRSGIGRAGGFTPANPQEIVAGLLKLFSQPYFLVGFVIYFLAAIVWFRVVASEPLSTAYPILVGLTFVLVTLAASIVFREPIAPQKAIGLAAIFIGIVLASTSGSVRP